MAIPPHLCPRSSEMDTLKADVAVLKTQMANAIANISENTTAIIGVQTQLATLQVSLATIDTTLGLHAASMANIVMETKSKCPDPKEPS
jgi:hypothetical protein